MAMATTRDPRKSPLGRLLSLSAAVWVAGTGVLSVVVSACATAAKYGGPPPESTLSPEADKYGGPRPEPSQAGSDTPAGTATGFASPPPSTTASTTDTTTANLPPPVVAKYGGPPPPQADKYGGPQPPPQPTRALKYGGPPLR
jgi:hypothetical protein